MRTIKTVGREIMEVNEIKGLIGVYEEIAAIRMQGVRKAVVDSQAYFEGLSRVSADVALDLSTALLGAPKKEAALFVSADAGLYGDIVDRVMVEFVGFVKEKKVDAFVSGTVGPEMIKAYAPEVKFGILPIPVDVDRIEASVLAKAMEVLNQYRQITVFHARFQSLVIQLAASSAISGPELVKSTVGLDDDEKEKIKLKNLYEPSITLIGEKFTTEISASIVEQSVKENQLAKYAARLMHLDTALENANDRLAGLHAINRKMRKKLEQKKQTERVSRLIAQRNKN